MPSVEEDRVSVHSSSSAMSPLGMVKSLRNSFRRTTPKSTPTSPPPLSQDPPCPSSPNPGGALNPLLQRGAQIRRSLFGAKKKDAMVSVNEEEARGGGEQQEAEEEVEEEVEELEEGYTLPELPHMPLSVMQINKLIENEVLEEAYMNLLALRLEFQSEAAERRPDVLVQLVKKEKDLNLLYTELKTKVCAIVRDSNSLPARNKKLLEFVARIIQEEERRASDPGGLCGSWMDFWRAAVQDGVQAKVDRVQLDSQEQNPSWLAVHLGILGKAVVSDLEGVRTELRWSYPPSFKVFGEYLKSYNRVLGRHVTRLEAQTTQVKDIYALLSWILLRYKSESILGHVSLQIETTDESKELELEPGFVSALKDKYCSRVQDDLRSSLRNITELENKEFWSERKEPESEEGFFMSDMHMDVWTLVKGNVTHSGAVEPELEHRVTCACLKELTHFPQRFELEFRRQCEVLRLQPIWTQYHVTYINSFSALLEHMESYRVSCPAEVESLNKEVQRFNLRLLQAVQDQFKDQVKIPLRRMMSRKWLTDNEDFKTLQKRTEELCQHCSALKEPHSQELASALHLHVSREYLEQLMKGNYSCKNRKHEKAAGKLRAQWGELQELFRKTSSCHDWLYPVGGALCDVIGQKQSSEIKNHLGPIVQHCPDFGRKHLVAVLWFRGPVRGREHRQILQKLSELKKKGPAPDKKRLLFSEMKVRENQDFFCLSFCVPPN